MKLTIILLTASLLTAHAGALSQNVTLNCDHTPLKKVFAEIKKQTGYSFFYNYESLKNARLVSMEVKNIPLQDVLSLCFSDQPLDYYVQNKTVFVTDRPASPESDTTRKVIHGKIVNDKGAPLDGVTIIAKGTSRGIVTNTEGEFVIKEAPGTVMVISRVGYINQELTLTKASGLTITLKARDNALQDVEVVNYSNGYQQIPKERSTGSFVQISGDELNRQVGSNALTKLFTITSGLIDNAQTLAKIEIRGLSTINSITDPLIVVDGFPYESVNRQGPTILGTISDINPNDIASITVLKDAAAASIWGVRAANGVIVIVTKKGAYNHRSSIGLSSNITVGGKPNLGYIRDMSSADEIAFEQLQFSKGVYNAYDDSYPGFNSFPALPQVAELLLSVRKGAITQAQADAQIAIYEHHSVKDDITKYILQKTIAQQHIVNMSGGSDKYTYYTSLGYDQARGSSIGDANSRFTLNFNNTFRPVKDFELSATVNYVQDKILQNGLPYSSLLPGNYITPYTMLADAQGHPLAIPYQYRLAFVDTTKSPGLLDWHYRPLAEQKYNDNVINEYHIRMNGVAKYNIFKGLAAVVNYQYEKVWNTNYNDQSDSTFAVRNTINTYTLKNAPAGTLPNQVPVGNIYSFSNNNQTLWAIRGSLNYNRVFGDHEVDALAGAERRQNSAAGNSGTLYGYDPTNLTSKPVNSGTSVTNYFGYASTISSGVGVSGSLNRYGSYFGNAAYTYKGRYTASGSARIDQSNFFGVKANQRLQPLWSSGAAWTVSKEDWYRVSWLPYLKFRTTYGFNGNIPSNTTAFPTAYYSVGTGISPTLLYANISSPNNPQLTFEKVRVINLAVEAASRNRRIGGSFEYYFKRATDLIGPITVDPTTGWLSFSSNNADLKGQGFDLIINTHNIEGKDFKWHTDFNLSYNTDKVTAYSQSYTAVINYFTDYLPVVGKTLYKVYAFRSAGLDPTTGDPRIYVGGKPTSYTTALNTAKVSDLKYVGPDFARYYGSMMNTFYYKQWSLSANIYYKMKWYFRRSSMFYGGLFNGWGGHSDYDKRWQKPGDEKITIVPSQPASSNGTRDEVYQYEDVLVDKGDYIRLQDVRLNYDLSKAMTKKWPFQSTQVFIYMNNVGIIWKANKDGLDPEAYGGSVPPNPRTISAGLNVNF